MKDMVFIGPPGSGKGTIGTVIDRAGLAVHVSTGDIIRDYLKLLPDDDPLHARIACGEFLNDDEITALLIRTVEKVGKHRIIFDGYPRNIEQAHLLDKILEKHGRSLQTVVQFQIDDSKIVERITGRYNCRSCLRVYHEVFNPAPKKGCNCGETEFIKRDDDREEIVEARLHRYHLKTEPLIAFYKERGLLQTVNSDQDIPTVSNEVLDLIH